MFRLPVPVRSHGLKKEPFDRFFAGGIAYKEEEANDTLDSVLRERERERKREKEREKGKVISGDRDTYRAKRDKKGGLKKEARKGEKRADELGEGEGEGERGRVREEEG